MKTLKNKLTAAAAGIVGLGALGFAATGFSPTAHAGDDSCCGSDSSLTYISADHHEGDGMSDKDGMSEKKDIVATAVAAGQFETLAKALEEAGLVETLKGDGPFTVFAPTDDAFDALPEGALDKLMQDKQKLKDVLLYHVVKGKAVPASEVLKLDGQTVTTAAGGDIDITVDGDTVMLNDDIKVIKTDVQASNGVIHTIDGVLMP